MNRNIRSATIQARIEHLACDFGDETVILQVCSGRYYGLNTVGTSLWRVLRRPHTFDDIVSELQAQYEVAKTTCEADVEQILEQMFEADLVEVAYGESA